MIGYLFLLGCQPAKQVREETMTNLEQPILKLSFGAQGVQDFLQYKKGSADNHPAGIGFYDLDWKPPKLGKVSIQSEGVNLEIDNVFSAMGVKYNMRGLDGIQGMVINSSLHPNQYVSRQEAYLLYVDLIKQLNSKGWKQYFMYSNGRVDKRDNLKHIMESLLSEVIDSSYILTYDEWEKVMSKKSRLLLLNVHNKGLQLSIMISQTSHDDNINKEQYMMRYEFDTKRYIQRNLIENSDQLNSDQLQDAFKKRLIEYQISREKEEADLKLRGYRIDENYKDPDAWLYVK